MRMEKSRLCVRINPIHAILYYTENCAPSNWNRKDYPLLYPGDARKRQECATRNIHLRVWQVITPRDLILRPPTHEHLCHTAITLLSQGLFRAVARRSRFFCHPRRRREGDPFRSGNVITENARRRPSNPRAGFPADRHVTRTRCRADIASSLTRRVVMPFHRQDLLLLIVANKQIIYRIFRGARAQPRFLDHH